MVRLLGRSAFPCRIHAGNPAPSTTNVNPSGFFIAATPGAGMTQTPPSQVTDPATGGMPGTSPSAPDAKVERAPPAATASFAEWRKRPTSERAAIVKRVAELFTE